MRKVGGFPLIDLQQRPPRASGMFFDVPEKYDTQADALGAKLAESSTW